MTTVFIFDSMEGRVRDETGRDPDLVHFVTWDELDRGGRRALCGFDCSGRSPRPGAEVSCVVCLDMKQERARLK